jgi:hypothetical protein
LRAAVLSALLLWQIADASGASGADSTHTHYVRPVELPPGASGQACAVLDGEVFAHAAKPSASDLRLYASRPGASNEETPFALTMSATEPEEAQAAAMRNETTGDGRVAFDLVMPRRAYTEVDLQVSVKNFLGAAEVSGSDGSHAATPLGTYPIFDLSAQGLARSTRLELREASYPVLHIELRLMDLDGRPLKELPAAVVTGVMVPPNRSTQTLYTTVASSSQIETQGQWSLTTLTVPAHVPLERVRFVVDPRYTRSFLRPVTIAATPIGKGYSAIGVAESVAGEIYQEDRSASTDGGMPAIDAQEMSVDTALGSNLRDSAKVLATVENGTRPPLPITAVELEMRQRRVCFDAVAGTSYVLRYGDDSLRVPVYRYAQRFVASASPVEAVLGPEHADTKFVRHSDERENVQSQTPWIVLMAVIVVGGVVGLQYMRRKENDA